MLKEATKELSAALPLSHVGHMAWELQLVLPMLLFIRH